jgi:integrase/recombinase XerD
MGSGLSSGAAERLEALEDGDEAEAFLQALASRGRSSYTLRTYALGLAHFLEWLSARATRLGEIERGDVVAYVAEFARNEVDGVVLGRAAATVNHRVSVLASLFAWLIERDQLAGEGAWVGGVSPVPPGSTGMTGGHGMPGRDAPRRGRRGELRRRVPHRIPARAEPAAVAALMEAARSARDRRVVDAALALRAADRRLVR